MLSKPEEQQTQECVTAIVQTIFHEWNFRCDTVANSMKTEWSKLKNAHYITEVQNLRQAKYNFGTFTGRTEKPITLAIILKERTESSQGNKNQKN